MSGFAGEIRVRVHGGRVENIMVAKFGVGFTFSQRITSGLSGGLVDRVRGRI